MNVTQLIFKQFYFSKTFLIKVFADRQICSFRTSKVKFTEKPGLSRFCTRKADLNILDRRRSNPNDYTDATSAADIIIISTPPLARSNKAHYCYDTNYLSNITLLFLSFPLSFHCLNIFAFNEKLVIESLVENIKSQYALHFGSFFYLKIKE